LERPVFLPKDARKEKKRKEKRKKKNRKEKRKKKKRKEKKKEKTPLVVMTQLVRLREGVT
jgi:hypothetical protein